jgi:hypothetical protein
VNEPPDLSGQRGVDVDDELAKALGHLRQAAHQLLRNADPTGQALCIAVQLLDLENQLSELGTEPTFVPDTTSVQCSVRTASRLLAKNAYRVPSEIWPALKMALDQVSDHGQR